MLVRHFGVGEIGLVVDGFFVLYNQGYRKSTQTARLLRKQLCSVGKEYVDVRKV